MRGAMLVVVLLALCGCDDVGRVLLSIAIIALVDALAALIGIESKALNMIGALVVWLGSIVWGVVVVRMALQKRYRDFRLTLIGTPTSQRNAAKHARR
jgi:dolichol kinase